MTATFGEKVSAADKAHPTYGMMNGARTESVEVLTATRMAVAEAIELSYRDKG